MKNFISFSRNSFVKPEESSVRSALRTLVDDDDATIEFLELLLRDSTFLLAGALIPVRREMDCIAKSLVHLFMTSQTHMLRFIKFIVQLEINDAPTHSCSELFRSNTVATKFLSDYTFQVGREYLRYMLAKPIAFIYQSTGSYEVNPSRVFKSNEDLAKNQSNLITAVEMFLRSILESSQHCPKQIQQICSYLRTSVGHRFRSHADTAVGGFLFLRFICPAVVTPSTIELQPTGSITTRRVQRGLVLVAKMLQSLANNVLFGPKEPFMKVFNPFIRDNYCSMLAFYDEICNFPLDRKLRLRPTSKNQKNGFGTDHGEDNLLLGGDDDLCSSSKSTLIEKLQPIRECIRNNLDFVAASIASTVAIRSRSKKFLATSSPVVRNGKSFKEDLRKVRKSARAASMDCSLLHRNYELSIDYPRNVRHLLNRVPSVLRLQRCKSDTSIVALRNSIFDNGRAKENVRSNRVQSFASLCTSSLRSNTSTRLQSRNVSSEALLKIMGTVAHRNNSVMLTYYSHVAKKGLRGLLNGSNEGTSGNVSSSSDNDGWVFWKLINGVKISRRKITESPQEEIRGVGVIKASTEVVYRYLKNFENRPFWDKMTSTIKEIEKLDDSMSIAYASVVFPATRVINPRDASYLISFFEEPEGPNTFAIVSESVYRDDVPEVRGFVRMSIKHCGFLLRPCHENSNYTELVYSVKVDPKGWLPKWLKQWTCVQQALCIDSIRQILEAASTCSC